MRVLFQMSTNDSASLIDSPKAGMLGLHRALFYNAQEGYLETFRPYALPPKAWLEAAGPSRWLVLVLVVPVTLLLAAMLFYVAFEPYLGRWARRWARKPVEAPERVGAELASSSYTKILVPLDHTHVDRLAVSHAASIARSHDAKLYLLHVEEDVTSQMFGALAEEGEGEQVVRAILSERLVDAGFRIVRVHDRESACVGREGVQRRDARDVRVARKRR